MLLRLSFLLFLFLPIPALAAQGVLYDCDMTNLKRGKGWISEKIAIVVRDNGTATVSDSLVLAVYSAPVAAESVRQTANRLTVRWTIRSYTNGSNQRTPYFDFEATIRKNGKISVYARPDLYHNQFSGTGTCTKRTS